jgi:hypothetical protein
MLANRTLVHLNPEQFLELLLQIDPAPSNNTILRQIRLYFCKGGQLLTLIGCQSRRNARRLPVDQPIQAILVVAMNPIAQGLALHAAGLGRMGTVRPFKTSANANIRRAAALLLLRTDADRSSEADKSVRVISIAEDIPTNPVNLQPTESEFI